MIQIEEHLILPVDPDELFRFLADFSNLPDWDPGIVGSRLIGAKPATEVGARYDVEVEFLKRRSMMTYETTYYDSTARTARIEGKGKGIVAVDHIAVHEHPRGAALTWKADFDLTLMPGIFEWTAKPLMVRLGKIAMRGLRSAVDAGVIPKTSTQTVRATA